MQKDNKGTEKSGAKSVNSKADTTKSSKSASDKDVANVTHSNAGTVAAKKGKGVLKVMGLAVLLVVVAVAGLLLVRYLLAQSNPPVASIEGETAMRIGQSQVLTFDSDQLKRGQTVCWYVNGKRVYCQKYDGKPLQYRYNATRQGVDHVRVDVDGKTYKWLNVAVGKMLASVKVASHVITYGDDLPQLSFTVDGTEGQTLLGCKAYVEGNPTEVGIYPIKFSCDQCDTCDVEIVEGTLEIVPRKLIVSNQFEKTYDGTCQLDLDELDLVGIVPGDDVRSGMATAYFADKNVGDEKQVILPSVELTGEDASNYCIDTSNLCGQILPKSIKVEGIEVASKNYDGTTKATLKSAGRLIGVVDGDVVAIGGCTASFSDCKVGKNKQVCLDNVCLVGRDKDNYVLDCNFNCTADIQKSYFDLILNKPDVVHGQTDK